MRCATTINNTVATTGHQRNRSEAVARVPVDRSLHDEKRRADHHRDRAPDLATTGRGAAEPAETAAGDALLHRALQREQEPDTRNEQGAREREAQRTAEHHDADPGHELVQGHDERQPGRERAAAGQPRIEALEREREHGRPLELADRGGHHDRTQHERDPRVDLRPDRSIHGSSEFGRLCHRPSPWVRNQGIPR